MRSIRSNHKVLVTGANGLLGTHIVHCLLTQGYSVRGLVRDRKKVQLNTSSKNLEWVEGNILNKKSIMSAVQHCDYVIHTAAITNPSIHRKNIYKRINTTGTENVLQEAVAASVKKFIYVSTANSIGHGTKDHPGNERSSIKEPFLSSPYATSKWQAEKKVLEAADNLHVTIVNPTFLIGKWDSKPTSGKIIQMACKQKIVFCPPGGKNFVNATDVAKAICSVLRKGNNKESFLLAGENLSYQSFFQKLRKHSSNKFLLVPVPQPLLLSMGYIGEILRFFRISTPLSIVNTRILCVKNYYSNHKAEKKLELQFMSIEQGIKETLSWFKQQDML